MKTFPRVIELFKKDIAEGGTLRGIVRKTGLNSNSIANYLEGRSEPTQSSLEKISAAYGRSVAWLRGDTDDATLQPATDAIDVRTLSPAQKAVWDRILNLPDDKLEKVLGVVELFWSEVQKDKRDGS